MPQVLMHVASNRIIFVLSIVGIIVSGVLTYSHIKHVNLPCGFARGCDVVAQHETAWGFGIPALKRVPTAAFGLLAYLSLLALCLVRAAAPDLKWPGTIQFQIAAVGVLVTAWLTYLEAYVIHAWCQWCLASAAVTVLVFLTTLAERLFVLFPPQGELI